MLAEIALEVFSGELLDQESKTITQTNASTLLDACIKNVRDRMQLVQSLSPQAKQPETKQPETKQQPQGR